MTGTSKVCPLRTVANMSLGDSGNINEECITDRCAWYGRYNQCTVKDIADAIDNLAGMKP